MDLTFSIIIISPGIFKNNAAYSVTTAITLFLRKEQTMFVYTLRANTLKFFSIIGVALIALVSLILFVPGYEVATTGAIQQEKEKLH